jgi:gamma-glutamyltranspeptidase/glutathione hydrolase
MTPTIAFRGGQPVLAIGGSGGLRIATGVTQAFLARTVFERSVAECVAMPRFHTPADEGPTSISGDEGFGAWVEITERRGGSTDQVRTARRADGRPRRSPQGGVRITAASDGRKGGVARVGDHAAQYPADVRRAARRGQCSYGWARSMLRLPLV